MRNRKRIKAEEGDDGYKACMLLIEAYELVKGGEEMKGSLVIELLSEATKFAYRVKGKGATWGKEVE